MSIRLRLALWCVSLLGVALLGFSLLLYVMMASHLQDMVEDELERHAAHVRDTLRATGIEPAALAAHSRGMRPGGHDVELSLALLHAFDVPGLHTDLLTREGDPLFAGRTRHPGVPSPPWAIEEAAAAGAAFHDAHLEGRRLRVALRPLSTDGTVLLQVAADYAEAERLLARLRVILVAGSAAVLLVGLTVGSAMAGEALRPIFNMIDTARAIALSQGFDRRIEGIDRRDELGRLAATFNQMLASLEEAYKSQQRFVADASHELRAPLATIQGNLELLQRQPDMPPDERRAIMADLVAETERLSRLVGDLLSLARADAGQPLALAPVQLDEVLVETFRSARVRAGDALTLRLARLEPVRVMGDRDRLKQLLFNLIDNALRYTPPGGQVTLELVPQGQWAVLTVADTGIGIAPADLPHIFERFYRADKARSRAKGGTGLGLAIARWIAHAHGGEIGVESEVGKGSRFTVRLPRLPEKGLSG